MCLIKLIVPTKIILCAMMKMIKGCKCADYYQCIQMSVETFHFLFIIVVRQQLAKMHCILCKARFTIRSTKVALLSFRTFTKC